MDEHEQPYTVVVGVSPKSGSPTALVWAHAQAEANGGHVIAVRVYQPPHLPAAPGGTSSRIPQDPAQLHADLQAQQERDVAEVLGPDHKVELRVIRGGKRRALLEQTHEAD